MHQNNFNPLLLGFGLCPFKLNTHHSHIGYGFLIQARQDIFEIQYGKTVLTAVIIKSYFIFSVLFDFYDITYF